MKDYKDIQQLIERFFEGETSLEEEQRLYAFYSSHPKLPEELESYRDMFAGFDAISFDTDAFDETSHDNTSSITVAPRTNVRRRLLYVLSGIAAAILLCIGIFVAVGIHEDKVFASNYEGSYIIVKGERITDLSRIKPDIEKALSQAENIEQHVDAHSVIKSAEQHVLDNTLDPKEKARILQLLNE